jgi:fucose permease
MIVAYSNSPKMAYILASGLLLIGAVLALMTKSPAAQSEDETPELVPSPVPITANAQAYAMGQLKSITK